MWQINFTENARKNLKKLDKSIQIRILNYLNKKELRNSPTEFGKILTGNKKGLWRYRVGDYRVICDIINHEITILVIDINHREITPAFHPTPL